MNTANERIAVKSWSPRPELIDAATLTDAEPGTLLLLPDKIGEEGQALYRDDNAGLVKTVRAQGARMVFAWPDDRRVYLSEFGAGEVIANIMLGVIGNFTTDAVKYIVYAIRIRVAAALGRSVTDDLAVDDAITVKIARFESSRDRRLVEGLECTGPAPEVVKIIESLTDASSLRLTGGESDGRRP